ncbi:MAG: hypothetical protein ACYC55_10250 [Candidatus Geothermincolia bacterium]
MVSREEGFTLAELIVFSVVLLLLLSGVMGMLYSAFRSSAVSYSTVKIEDAAREALSTMVRQIRVATDISFSSNAGSITITGDLDGDNVDETAAFTATGGWLLQNGAAWIEHVDSVVFTYYAANGTVLVPGTLLWNTYVHRVSIRLTLSREAMGVDSQRSFESSVSLRNNLGL